MTRPIQDTQGEIAIFDSEVMSEGFEHHSEEDYERFWAEAGVDAKVKGLSAIDVGCSSGAFGRRLARKGWKMTGVDLSPTLVRMANKLAREEKIKYRAKVADVFKEAKKGARYDLIFCGFVLHHFMDLDSIVEALSGMLRPGGRFVLLEPNGSQPLIKFAEWVRRDVWPFSRMTQFASPNETNHDLADYKRALERAGLKIERRSSFETHAVPGDYGFVLNIVLSIKKWLILGSNWLMPKERSGSALVISARKGKARR